MNLTIKKFLEIGTNSNQSDILKRSLIVFNFYCYLIILIAIILCFVSYFFDRTNDSITGLSIAIVCLIPLRLSHTGHIILSRILLCFLVTIPVLCTSVINKMDYTVVLPPHFFEDRFIFLASVILPLTLFRLSEKRWLILGLSFSFLSLLLYDPLHNILGMGYYKYDFDLVGNEYYFSGNFYPLIPYFFIVFGFLFIKSRQERSETFLLKKQDEIESKNKLLSFQAKELEAYTEELKANNEQLIQLSEFKETITGMIVHDFKNDLNTIISFSNKTPTADRLKSIKNASRHMLNMSLDMLDVQKFEQAEVKLGMAAYSIPKIINEALEQVTFLIEQKSLNLTHKISAKLYSNCDLPLINRVFTNLLTNAIKYTPMNGSIHIEAIDLDEYVKLSVSDTGQGIPKEKLNTIFDKFAQVNEIKSGEVRSTGLGLTFCKMAVEAHGGEIGVESEESIGATFWFTLEKAENPKSGQEQKIEITVDSEKDTIFELKEDDKNFLEPYVKSLQEWEVYDFSEVNKILENIESEEENVLQWKERIMNSLRNGNEDNFKQLLSESS